MTLQADSIAEFYQAWNVRDAERIARTLAGDGSFHDPLSLRPLREDVLRAHLDRLIASLPQLTFSVARIHRDGPHAVGSWTLDALCKGSLDGELTADGVPFTIRGVDVIELASDGRLQTVTRHFDRRALAEQLGLQTIVEPVEVGTMTFGYSLRDWVSKAKPALLGMTWIQARDEDEKAKIRGYARSIIKGFHDVQGYIGVVTGFAGLHGFTLTAWESEDALRAGVHGPDHVEAMRAFHLGTSTGVFTSVWQPLRLNRMWQRCPHCAAMNDAQTSEGRCTKCGSALPESSPYL